MSTALSTSAPALGEHLRLLYAQRAVAKAQGLSAGPGELEDLDQEIAHYRRAYVGAAVTDIAVLRAELSGALHG